MTVWTDERVAELKELHAKGYSFSQIGTALGGVTRNACIGKAKRLGLERRGAWNDPSKPRKPRSPSRRYKQAPARPQTFAAFDHYAPDEIEPLPSELPADAIPLEQRKTFAQLKSHHCRFIYGEPTSSDFFYCGAVKSHGAYCAYHYNVTHRTLRLSPLEREQRRQHNITSHRITTEVERTAG